MASSTEEEDNFFRVYKLIIGVGTEAVRNTFDKLFPPGNLVSTLKSEEPTIKHLKQQKRITTQQMLILYPSNGLPSSSEFDITLMVCLIRNLTLGNPVNPPANGYDVLPSSIERGVGADLARMKYYRNKYAHTSSNTLSNTNYQGIWKDISEAIIRLGKPNCKQICDDLKNEKMNRNIIMDMKNQIKEAQEQTTNQMEMIETKIEQVIQETNMKITEVTLNTERKIEEVSKDTSSKSKLFAQDTETKIREVTQETETKIAEVSHDTEMKIRKVTQEMEVQIKKVEQDAESKLSSVNVTMEAIQKNLKQLNISDPSKFKEVIDKITQLNSQCDIKDWKTKALDETQALIEQYEKENTFVTSLALTRGLSILESRGKIVITGNTGSGKSRLALEMARLLCGQNLDKDETDNTKGFKTIKVDCLDNLKHIDIDDKFVVVFDDAFGPTNCNFDPDRDMPILDNILAYVSKGNVKVIITVRNSLKRYLQRVFEKHRLFEDVIDISSEHFQMSTEERIELLLKYLSKYNECLKVSKNGLITSKDNVIVSDLLRITTSTPFFGFPQAVYMFASNPKYTKLGYYFFEHPTRECLTEINNIRKEFKLDFAVLVYTVLNGNKVNPQDDTDIQGISKAAEFIYGQTLEIRKINILDAIDKLCGAYLIHHPNTVSYCLQHQILVECVLLSIGSIDTKKVIPLLDLKFITEMTSSKNYVTKDGEVVLRIPIEQYKQLADRLIEILFTSIIPNWFMYFTAILCFSNFYARHEKNLISALLEGYSKAKRTLFLRINLDDAGEIRFDFDTEFHLWEGMLVLLSFFNGKGQILIFLLEYYNHISNSKISSNLQKQYRSTFIQSIYCLCKTSTKCHISLAFDIAKKHNIFFLWSNENSFIPNDMLLSQNEEKYVSLSRCLLFAYNFQNIEALQFLLPFTTGDYNIVLKNLYTGFEKVSSLDLIQRNPEIIRFFPLDKTLPITIDHPSESLEFVLNCMKPGTIDEKQLLCMACRYKLPKTAIYLLKRLKPAHVDLTKYMHMTLNDDFHLFRKSFIEVGFSYENEDFLQVVQIVSCLIQEMLPALSDLEEFISLCEENHYFSAIQCILENNTNGHQFSLDDIMHAAFVRCELSFVTWIFSYNDSFREKYGNQEAMELVCEGKLHPYFFEAATTKDNEKKRLELLTFLWQSCENTRFDMCVAVRKALSVKRLPLVLWILKNCDIDINSSGLDPQCIMEMACSQGNIEALQFLLENIRMSQLEMKNSIMLTLIGYAGCGRIYHHDILDLSPSDDKYVDLLSTLWDKVEDKTVFWTTTALETSVRRNKSSIIKWVLDNLDNTLNDIEMAFLFCCQKGYPEVIAKIIKIKNVTTFNLTGILTSVCTKTETGKYNERLKVLRILLEKVNHNVFDDFHQAAVASLESGGFKLFMYLLKNVDEKQFIIMDLFKMVWMPMKVHLARWMANNVDHSHFDVASIVFEACADAMDISEADRLYIIYSLWEDIHRENFEFEGAIQSACCKKRFLIVLWLLKNVRPEAFNLQITLDLCCKFNQIEVVEYMLSTFHTDLFNIKLALVEACRSDTDEKDVVDYLLSKLELGSFDEIISKCLCSAVKENNYNIVLSLLEHFGHRVNFQKMLDFCCKYGAVKIVQRLVIERDRITDVTSSVQNAIKCSKADQIDCIECLKILWDTFDQKHFDLRHAIAMAKKNNNNYILDWLENKAKLKKFVKKNYSIRMLSVNTGTNWCFYYFEYCDLVLIF